MSEYDQTFDPNLLIGHCVHGSVILPYIWALNWFMFAYDKTFDPEVFPGHCDLISWFSNFALYLDTLLVFFVTSFRL